jgi:carbon monoxide dehydrogenase subunit G
MRLANEFRSARPADELFALLADVERVAPCLPGATLEGRDDEDWTGRMDVRIGPIKASYRGSLRQLVLDEGGRRSVMVASADEQHGGGNAEARITTWVEPHGDGSLVRVETDLQLRGRLAQFGRGAIDKIAQRMLETFAANLERAAAEPAPSVAGDVLTREKRLGASGAATGGPAVAPPVAALDLGALGLRVPPWAPAAAVGLLVGLGYGYLLGRLRGARA